MPRRWFSIGSMDRDINFLVPGSQTAFTASWKRPHLDRAIIVSVAML
jgi:hypothetical protein